MVVFKNNPSIRLRRCLAGHGRLRQFGKTAHGSTDSGRAVLFPFVVSRPKAGSSHGFSLIETLVALAIIALVLTPIFVTQTIVVRRSGHAARSFGRLLAQKRLLLATEFSLEPGKQEFTTQQKIAKPATQLTYVLKKLPETSSLKKFKNIAIESVTASWSENNKKKQDALVTFLYRPEVSS